MTESTNRPWPRFTAETPVPPARQPSAHEPWPRWGWFPREQRTWTFAPGPSLVADAPVEREPIRPALPPEEPLVEDEREAEEIARSPSASGVPEVQLLPVRRSTSTALVPVRDREISLAAVGRAIRRAAPVAAIAGVATAAAMTFFRRR